MGTLISSYDKLRSIFSVLTRQNPSHYFASAQPESAPWVFGKSSKIAPIAGKFGWGKIMSRGLTFIQEFGNCVVAVVVHKHRQLQAHFCCQRLQANLPLHIPQYYFYFTKTHPPLSPSPSPSLNTKQVSVAVSQEVLQDSMSAATENCDAHSQG